MALNTNQLYSETTRAGLPAIQPQEGPGASVTRTFAAGTDEVLAVGTPVYVNVATGLLAKCDPTALPATDEHEVFAFVYPRAITTDATNEVVGTVMARGSIEFDAVEAIRAAGGLAGTAQELLDMLRRPELQTRGLFVDGLTRAGATTEGLANP